MDEFASAAMLRVLIAGMAREGLPVPAAAEAAARGVATVGLDVKRALLEAACRDGGLARLVHLGAGVHDHVDDPTHRALAAARDGLDLVARWQRLERYAHSAHRVVVREAEPGRIVLEHVSRSGRAPPAAAEDLVVLGVIAALMRAAGLREVSADIAGVPVLPRTDAAALQRLAADGRTGTWTVRWVDRSGRDTDVVPGPVGVATTLGTTAPDATALEVGSPAWPDVARRLARATLADPLEPPGLAEAAHRCGTSARSLQRTLARSGLTLSRIVSETRLRAAARWLVDTRRPIAEIGFLCGWSDQPHFTREFSRSVGLPPGRYRELFGRTARPADDPSKQ